MKVYLNDSMVAINNHFERKLFIYDRKYRNEYEINEETFNCIEDIKSKNYDLDSLNNMFEEDFIQQLFKLNILTFDKQDYVNNVKKFKKFNNVRLFVELTNKCNLRCKHCYGGFGFNNDKSLDVEQLKQVIHDASESGAYQLDLTGGEPMLYPHINELLEFAYKEGMLVRIFTNLTLLTEKSLNMLIKYGVKEIVTSLDSCYANAHDIFRGQNGCFDKTINAIKILKKKNMPVSVNTMIGNHNKDDIDTLVMFISELNVKSVLDVIVPEGRGTELNENIKDSAKIIKRIYDNYYKIIDKNAISVHCGIGNRFIYIKSDGNIYVCPSLIEEKYKMGNIYDYSTEKIWEKMKNNFSFLDCSSKCKKCGNCKGGCRARALKMNNDICAKDDVYCIINEIGDTND